MTQLTPPLMRRLLLPTLAICVGLWGWAADALAADAPGGALVKIKATGAIVLGMREASVPLSYLDEAKRPRGYHIEICDRVAEAARSALGLAKLQIQHQLVTSQNRLPMLTSGLIDLECGSTTNNLDRQQQVAFAPTTFVTEVRMAVRKGSGINSVADLAGKTVVTTSGSTIVKLLRQQQSQRPEGVAFRQMFGKDHDESFHILESGRADAFVMDDYLLAGRIAWAEHPEAFTIVGDVWSVEPIAIVYRKDDPDFARLVDGTVTEMMRSGEMEQLYAKWFQSPIPPKGVTIGFPLSDRLSRAFRSPNATPTEAINVVN